MARARARTENIETDQLDFFIEEFYSRDQTALKSIGAHDKVIRWKIRVVGVEGQLTAPPPAPGAPPPPDDAGTRAAVCQTKELEVHVKKSTVQGKVQGSEISVVADNENLFPGPVVSKPMARMKEDFSYGWKFRGTVQGLGHSGLFELDMGRVFEGPDGASQWIDCVIVEQRPDGLFEIAANSNPAKPTERVMYPGIRPELVRFKSNEKTVTVPEHTLVIEVPKENPLKTTLLVNDRPMTLFLGRGSPAGSSGSFGSPTEPVRISVDKERKACTVGAGHTLISQFISSEVLAGESMPAKLKKTWVLQVGPFAEHNIQIERKYQSVGVSSIVTLTVDGTTLVESNADDIDTEEGKWSANWRFFGERFIEWDLQETDRHGTALETRGGVRQPFRFNNKIEVRITDERDFSSADLFVDGTNFRELRQKLPPHGEAPTMQLALEVLQAQYKLEVPFKVKWEPPGMLDHLQAGALKAGVAAAPVAAQAAEAAGQAAGFLQSKMGEMIAGQAAARASVADDEPAVDPGPMGFLTAKFGEMFGGAAEAPAGAPSANRAPPAESQMSI